MANTRTMCILEAILIQEHVVVRRHENVEQNVFL